MISKCSTNPLDRSSRQEDYGFTNNGDVMSIESAIKAIQTAPGRLSYADCIQDYISSERLRQIIECAIPHLSAEFKVGDDLSVAQVEAAAAALGDWGFEADDSRLESAAEAVYEAIIGAAK